MSAPDPLAVSLALAAAAREVEQARKERDEALAEVRGFEAAARQNFEDWTNAVAECQTLLAERDAADRRASDLTRQVLELQTAWQDNAEMLSIVAAERDAILDAWQRADEFKGWAQYDRALDACQRRIAGLLGRRERQVLAVATAKLEAILAGGTVLGVAARILREVHADLTALTGSTEPKETP